MKNQALFSSNDKIKKLKCRLLQFLFGPLRVNDDIIALVQILDTVLNRNRQIYFKLRLTAHFTTI